MNPLLPIYNNHRRICADTQPDTHILTDTSFCKLNVPLSVFLCLILSDCSMSNKQTRIQKHIHMPTETDAETLAHKPSHTVLHNSMSARVNSVMNSLHKWPDDVKEISWDCPCCATERQQWKKISLTQLFFFSMYICSILTLEHSFETDATRFSNFKVKTMCF